MLRLKSDFKRVSDVKKALIFSYLRGDGEYTLLGNVHILPQIEGIDFRGGASPGEMAKKFNIPSLHFISPQNGQRGGPHYSAVSLILFIRKLSDDLCQLHPKNRQEFIKKISKFKANHFLSPLGIGIYKLKDSKLTFERFATK